MLKPISDSHLRFPSNLFLGCRNVWPSLAWVILGFGKELYLGLGASHVADVLREVLDRIFIRVAQIDRQVIVTIHQLVQAIDQIRNVLERARLLACPVNSNVLILQSLDDEIGHDTSVVGMHPRSECVEDASNTNLDIVLVSVGVHHRFSNALAFIVARAGTDCVDITPVRFVLRMDLRVTIDLRRGGEQHPRLDTLGEAEHVDRPHGGRLDGLHGVVLVVWGRGGTRQVIDLIDLDCDGLSDIVHNEAEKGK
mmetsp:Transcript_39193/g.117845  ORF Transcript_39193/g.117845 Transcript_39193/m.117845 type:complete len:253 (+) Transcript_39193:463-1221(+)